MNLFRLLPCAVLCVLSPLKASTIVISAVSDENHPLEPLCSADDLPLPAGVEVRIGAFPGMTRDAVLDAARQGGYGAISALFIPFGQPSAIGNGADGEAGRFEIAARQPSLSAASPLAGAEISLIIIIGNNSQEFLIAGFPGKRFRPDSETGIEPLENLHLSSAKLIVGSRLRSSSFATALPPLTGSFGHWIAQFPSLADSADLTSGSDPDHDGQSNFLEYSTGGNPALSSAVPACRIVQDSSGNHWVQFRRRLGIGALRYSVETTSDLSLPWQLLPGVIEKDPTMPAEGPEFTWVRIIISRNLPPRSFFRLKAVTE